MQFLIPLPLVLIALGGTGLVLLRDARQILGAFLLQWLGLVWALAVASPPEASLGVAVVEGVTALACGSILGTTLLGLQRLKVEELPGVDEGQRELAKRAEEKARDEAGARRSVYELVWQAGVVAIAGLVGLGLATYYPAGFQSASLTAFYWLVLGATLALVLDGARDPVKLAVGLLALINAGVLLVVVLSPAFPGPVVQGLLALSRIGMAALMAYSWSMLKILFLSLNMNVLFDMRSGLATEKALVVVLDEGPGGGGQGSGVTEEPPEVPGEDEVEATGTVESEAVEGADVPKSEVEAESQAGG